MLLTADITFKGTTTSPVILFMKKEKVDNLNYDTMLIYSPKYKNPTISKMKDKEINFLGYEFSDNRNKTGINVLKNSILSQLIKYNNEHLKNKNITIPNNLNEYIKIIKMNDLIINKSDNYFGDIYPKYLNNNGKAINQFCKINQRTEKDFSSKPTKYFEISNFTIKGNHKNKTTNRYCKKGDIIISSLNPVAKNIQIADDDYMCSPAIYVLHDFENDTIRDDVLKKLKSNNVLEQMNSMCDGFKITYAKISTTNFYNNVKL